MQNATYRAAQRLLKSRHQAGVAETKLIQAIKKETGADFARLVGVSAQHICDIQKDRRAIGDALLAKIIEAGK